MTAKRRTPQSAIIPASAADPEPDYGGLLTGISDILDQARRMTARTVNNILTATYWEIGRRIVEYEQGGKARAEYGEVLLKQLSQDLTARHGRGFSRQGLQKMRAFYTGWKICPTPSGKFEAWVQLPPNIGVGNDIQPTPSAEFKLHDKLPHPEEGGSGRICSTASGKSEIAQTPSVASEPHSGFFDLPPLMVPLRSLDVG